MLCCKFNCTGPILNGQIIYTYVSSFADEPIDVQNPTCEECKTIPHKYSHLYCGGVTTEKHTICLDIPLTWH